MTLTEDLFAENEINIYPNPSDELVFIEYNLQQTAVVQITIYDALGREVSVLVNESQLVGQYQLQWSATTAGIYFVNFMIDGHSYAERVVVME